MSCSYASEIQLLGCSQHVLDAVGNDFQAATQVTLKKFVTSLRMKKVVGHIQSSHNRYTIQTDYPAAITNFKHFRIQYLSRVEKVSALARGACYLIFLVEYSDANLGMRVGHI